MVKKRIQPTTCFALGFAGAFMVCIAGILMLLGLGQASLLKLMGFALTGGMLLFLATTERGNQKKPIRTRLLILFFLLILSYLNLPPLSNLAGGLVIPLVFLQFRSSGHKLALFLVFAAELVLFIITMMGLITFWGALTLQVTGGAYILAAGARMFAMYLLYKQASQLPPLEKENSGNRLH